MIILRDLLGEAQDEILTDCYKIEEIDGIILKVTGKLKTEKTEISDAMFGGNASAEGADEGEGGDTTAVSGIDVVLSHRLVDYDIKKKDFMTHIKEYMGKVKKHLEKNNPDELDMFLKNASKFVKELLAEFKEWNFYCGESMNPDGMLIMCKWDGETPYLYYFKHGLLEEKV